MRRRINQKALGGVFRFLDSAAIPHRWLRDHFRNIEPSSLHDDGSESRESYGIDDYLHRKTNPRNGKLIEAEIASIFLCPPSFCRMGTKIGNEGSNEKGS